MSCSRCNEEIGTGEFVKCDGGCKRIYHLACAGTGRGVTKTFYNAFIENEYFLFMCSNCRSSSLQAVNAKLDKIMSVIEVYNERVRRQDEDIKELKDYVKEGNDNSKTNIVDLTNKITEIKEVVKHNEEILIVNKPTGRKTYVDIVKERRNDPALLVVPKNKNQNSEETRRIIKEKVDPVKNPVNLARRIMNGGIALECTNFVDKDSLQKSVSEQMGIENDVHLTELKKPKIKIVGMYDEWDDETLIKKLKEQNEFMANSDVKIVHKFKGLRGSHNVVLEVSDNSFIKILEAGRVRIHFENCRVLEDINIYRCYKCCGYNHKARDCSSLYICKYCAENHDSRTCTSDYAVCINCKKAAEISNMNLNVYHTAIDNNCVIYKRKMELARQRIDSV